MGCRQKLRSVFFAVAEKILFDLAALYYMGAIPLYLFYTLVCHMAQGKASLIWRDLKAYFGGGQ